MWIVPTRFGLGMLAALVVMYLWILNYRLNLGYLLFFLTVAVLAFSAVMTSSIMARLRVSAGEARPVFVGEEALVPVIVQEEGGRARPAFVLANAWQESACAGVAAGETATVYLAQPALVRGWQALAPLEMRTTLPLDLWHAWQWFTLKGQFLVYPAPVGDLPLPQEMRAGRGTLQSNARGEEEFAGLARYTPGDALSRVAWKQSSRGEWMLKHFSGTGGAEMLLDFEALSGDSEARLSQLARWIVDAHQAGLRYGVRLPTQEIAVSQGEAHYHACLRALAEF